MPYTPQTWDDDNPLYPVSATRMAHIETGIQTAQSTADAAGTSSVKNYLDVTTSPYNCIGDGESVTDGAIANGSPTLTTAAAVRMKIGQKVYVIGAGAAGVVLNTSVLSLLSSTQVTLANSASTTIASGGTVVFGTDNRAGIMSAHAVGRPLFFPASPGKFYLVDIGTTSANTLTFSGTYMRWIGESREQSVVRMGPEGFTGVFGVLAQVGSGQTWTFDNICLQGPDKIGAGGLVHGVVVGSATGALRLIDCWVRRFNTLVQVNATSPTATSIEAINSKLEGYGTIYSTICVGAFEAGGVTYTPGKYIHIRNCDFLNFGDPAGGALNHAVYVYTSHDLDISGCNFHAPASTSIGNVVQHYDSSVGLTNQAKQSVITDCNFNSATMTGILTAYNIITKVTGCTFASLTSRAINLNGEAIIDGNTFDVASAMSDGVIRTQSQDATGLAWGGQITNNAYTGAPTGAGAAAIEISHTTSSSDFIISGNNFTSFNNSSTYYILIFGGGSVANGNLSIEHNTFAGAVGAAISGDSSSNGMHVTVRGNRFYNSGKVIKNVTTALADLYFKDNEISTFLASDTFQLSVTPPILDISGSFGSIGYPTTNGGTSTQSPGAVGTVTIAHGLGNASLAVTPSTFSVLPGNANARGAPAFFVSADTTNITLTFASNLTAATSYSWVWRAQR